MPFCPKCRDEFQDWVKICPDCKVELIETLPPLPPPEPKPPPVCLITVADFRFGAEAHLAKAKLESEGIPGALYDEHILTADYFYMLAIGGIKLKVREQDFADAVKILTEIHDTIPGQAEFSDEGCPRCKSDYIRYESFQLRSFNYIMLLSALFTFLIMGGIYIIGYPFFKGRWKCGNCGYLWKE